MLPPEAPGCAGVFLKRFFFNWVINILAVLIAVYVLHGIHYEKPLDLIVAALLLGVLNSVLRPLLVLLALPLVVLSLGLFIFVINGLVLYLISYLMRPHFYVDSLWDALWGALLISFISLVLNALTGGGKAQITVRRSPPPSGGGPGGDGNGPVIDV